MRSAESLGFNEFWELYWIDKAQKALTPEHLKSWRDGIRVNWDIPNMIASNMLPRLIDAYVAMLEEKIGVWDKFILNKTFLQLEYNDLGYIQTIGLDPDAVDWVHKRLQVYVNNIMERENIWEDLLKWFWNSSVYKTLDAIFNNFSFEELNRMSDQDWANTYSQTLAATEPEYFSYMFDLYTKHLAEFLTDSLLFNKFSLFALEEFLGLKDYKTALPSLPAKILEARANYLTTFSMAYYQQLRRVVAAREFTLDKNGYHQAKLVTASGNMHGKAVFQPEDSKEEQLCACLNKMNDETVDVLDVICHLWLKAATEPTMFVQVTADQILRLRGLQEQKNGKGKRGGYKREWKERIAGHIDILHNTWIATSQQTSRYYSKNSRKVEQNEQKHRVILLADPATGGEAANKFQWLLRPGDLLAAHLKGSWRQTALLSQKILQLDPYRQAYEKRIARYFSWLWRSRQRKALYLEPIRIKTILDSICMNYQDARAAKVVERFEKMMDTLLDLGIINAWQYDGINVKWRDWLDCKIIVEPPAEIIQHYEKISSRSPKSKIDRKNGSQKFEISSEAFRAERLRRKMTQMQAAEQIGVHQTTISKLENGYIPNDKKIIQKIRKWMLEGA